MCGINYTHLLALGRQPSYLRCYHTDFRFTSLDITHTKKENQVTILGYCEFGMRAALDNFTFSCCLTEGKETLCCKTARKCSFLGYGLCGNSEDQAVLFIHVLFIQCENGYVGFLVGTKWSPSPFWQNSDSTFHRKIWHAHFSPFNFLKKSMLWISSELSEGLRGAMVLLLRENCLK